MKELKFNSQICTTKEQSQRLLELGLKLETADMRLIPYSEFAVPMKYNDGFFFDDEDYTPAWSLHRLIEMCNKTQVGMTISIYNNEVTIDGDLFESLDNTYDNLISVIEWLIEGGHFNKEYLNTQNVIL